MLLITYLYFHYCNRFWWWILRPPGFFLGFCFRFSVCHPKARCSPHTQKFLFVFFSLIIWYSTSFRRFGFGIQKIKAQPTVSDNETSWGSPGRERERERDLCTWRPPSGDGPGYPQSRDSKIKIKRNYEWNTRRAGQMCLIYTGYIYDTLI